MRLTLLGLSVVYVALSAKIATPEGWAGFYRASPLAPVQVGRADAGVCVAQIQQAQERYGIPDNLLLAIGIQEAGRQVDGQLTVWPWTANTKGKGAFFETKAALETWVRQTQASGKRSIDVGCMQVNQRWHAQHFTSLEEATDPVTNVDYAARFLVSLYRETGDWWEAAGRYHSSTPSFKDIYLRKLVQNQKLANATRLAEASPTPQVQEGRSPLSRPGINWSSDMTGSGSAQMRYVMSIYSDLPLQPFLPNYIEVN